MTARRNILHVDMDAFFANVEILDNPDLAGKPLVVGHDGPRGVVATASYEARTFGCHSAQPIAVAKRQCPDLIIVPPRGHRYRELSQQVFNILHDLAPLVQPVSIDEAFLDVTGVHLEQGDPVRIARLIRQRILNATRLTASVGVAPNRFLAKLASDMNKPDGLTVVGHTQPEIDAILLPLPITRLWGVGPATARKMHALGVRTFADLRALTRDQLTRHFGQAGADHYYRLCRGIDDRPVTSDRNARSISQEHTFERDLPNAETARQLLLSQTEQVAYRLRRHSLLARTVHIKLRYGDFETITRSATLNRPTDLTAVLYRATKDLFDAWARNDFRPLRLVGMGVSQLTREPDQLELFTDPQDRRQKQVDTTLDQIRTRFGKRAIGRGGAPDRPD